ncbi:MAG: hypothetical protein J7501_10395 [Bdellovibrio sp.]|nr:hypothetical protein [Bdellovibrio sp.]
MKLRTALLIGAVFVAFASAAHAEVDYGQLYGDGSYFNPPFVNTQINVQPERLATVLRLDYKSWKEVPQIFSQFIPGQDFDRPRGAVSVYIGLTNDYNFLGPVGVKSETDDAGYTHGANIAIGGFLPNGYYITFDYSTDLYTSTVPGSTRRLANGEKVDSQYFTNDNVYKIVIDSIDKNRAKAFYWKVEAGWQNISSQSTGGALRGTTQQKKFHDLMNSARANQITDSKNVRDGRGDRDGLILGMYVGVAKEFLNAKNTCRVRAFAEGGTRMSTISGASYLATDAGGVLWCQRGEKAMTYKVSIGYKTRTFEDGFEGTRYIDLSAGKRNWKLGFRVEQSNGTLLNYVNYNLRNEDNGQIDPLFILYYQYSFR